MDETSSAVCQAINTRNLLFWSSSECGRKGLLGYIQLISWGLEGLVCMKDEDYLKQGLVTYENIFLQTTFSNPINKCDLINSCDKYPNKCHVVLQMHTPQLVFNLEIKMCSRSTQPRRKKDEGIKRMTGCSALSRPMKLLIQSMEQ